MEQPDAELNKIDRMAQALIGTWSVYSYEGKKVFESITFEDNKYMVFNISREEGLYTFELDLSEMKDIYIEVSAAVYSRLEDLGLVHTITGINPNSLRYGGGLIFERRLGGYSSLTK